jgi:hypothetical protein
LPHLSQEKRYRDFFRKRSTDDYIILDNGAAEALEFGTKHLYTVADDLMVDEIVVPDTLGDMNDTIAKGLAFTRYTKDYYRYMAVAQGTTVTQIMQCIDMYMTDVKFMYVTCIGIPRLINYENPSNRATIARLILQKGYHAAMEFHFLGSSSPFDEVEDLANVGIGRGIDTSGPIYMAQAERTIDDQWIPRPDNYFESSKVDDSLLRENIRLYLEWAMYDRNAELPEKASSFRL